MASIGSDGSRSGPGRMTSIINKADPLNPMVVTSFLDYVQARGIFVDSARQGQASRGE